MYDSGESLPAATLESAGTLFGRTMTVLILMMGVTTFTSYLAWSWQPSATAAVVLFLAMIGCIFWAGYHLKTKDFGAGALPTISFAALQGLLLGPVCAEYTKVIGPEMVTYAFLGTIGIATACGFFAYMFQLEYAKLEGFLMMALLGLIGFGVGFILFGMPAPKFDMVYCGLTIIVFIGFFLVDFARLRDNADGNGWGAAGFIAMSIYLDMVNVFLSILRIMADKKSDD